MKLKLDLPKLLVEGISTISDIVNEAKIKVDKTGLSITAIDPANVVLVSFSIPAKAFSQLEADNEQIGLNLDDFKQVLRRLAKSSSIVLETKDNLLEIKSNDAGKRAFNLALINLDTEEKKVPEFDFTSAIEMNSSLLSQAVEDAGIVSDSCSFTTTPESFIIEAKGSLNKMRAEFNGDEVSILKTGNDKAKYSIEYLKKFMKAQNLAEKVKLSFKTDHPANIEFKHDNIDLRFIIAPRIEEEE